MTWQNFYDAHAEKYVNPEVVKSWYARNVRYLASWDYTVVESWFTVEDATDRGNATTSEGGKHRKKATDTGAIMGSVVGGV